MGPQCFLQLLARKGRLLSKHFRSCYACCLFPGPLARENGCFRGLLTKSACLRSFQSAGCFSSLLCYALAPKGLPGPLFPLHLLDVTDIMSRGFSLRLAGGIRKSAFTPSSPRQKPRCICFQGVHFVYLLDENRKKTLKKGKNV